MGVAILRYRLYDIDLIINRTLVYGSLTVTLVSLYFGGVVVTQTLFRALTGQQQQPQLAIVVSTLAIAALFNPLRHRIQSLIDRRFYRKKYDAARVLEAFSARLRDETDLDRLEGDVVAVVRETVQPEHTYPCGCVRPEDGRWRGSGAMSARAAWFLCGAIWLLAAALALGAILFSVLNRHR